MAILYSAQVIELLEYPEIILMISNWMNELTCADLRTWKRVLQVRFPFTGSLGNATISYHHHKLTVIFYHIEVSALSHFYKEISVWNEQRDENCINMFLWKFKNNLLRHITPLQFCATTVLFYGAIPASNKKCFKLLNLVIGTTALSLCFIAFWLAQTNIQYSDFKSIARILYVYEVGLVTLSIYFQFITNRKKILRCTRDVEYLSTLSHFKGNWLSVGGRLGFLFAQCIYTSHLLNSVTLKAVVTIMMYWIIDGLALLLSEIYIQIIFLLRHEYGRIKADLGEWIESYNNNPEIASEYRLLQIQRRHGILCHLANNLDKIYSLEIFLYVTQNITFILMIIIAPSNYTLIRETLTVANIIFYVDKPFNIIYPCLMTELLRRTMIESEKVIYKIRLDKCNPEIFNTLTLISLQLKYRKPRFDCGGFVKMDIRFVVSIMKVLISYTATLAQLSKNQ